MSHKTTFKEIKQYIRDNTDDIKVDGIDSFDGTLEDFILNLFTVWYNRNTVFAENGTVQTKAFRRRTISDIYMLCRHYFETPSLSKIYKILIDLISKNILCSAICSDLCRRVYRGKISGYDSIGFFNSVPTDEFGVNFTLLGISNCRLQDESGWGTEYDNDDLEFLT